LGYAALIAVAFLESALPPRLSVIVKKNKRGQVNFRSKIMNMKDFRRARKRVEVSVGESVRIVRELQGLTQNGLSKLTGIPQSTISAIENDSVNLGVERAKVLARALNCHPAVLVFPGWEVEKESAA